MASRFDSTIRLSVAAVLASVLAGCAGYPTVVSDLKVSPSEVNPRLLAGVTFCLGSICVPLMDVPDVPRSHDVDLPLLQASEQIKNAVGRAVIDVETLAKRNATIQKEVREFQKVVIEGYKKYGKVSPMMINPLLDVVQKVLRPKARQARVRTCLEAYFEAWRRVVREDPFDFTQRGCRSADPAASSETFVATMELMARNHNEVLLALQEADIEKTMTEAATAFNSDPALSEMMERMPLIEILEERIKNGENLISPEGVRGIEKANAAGGAVWRASLVRQVCKDRVLHSDFAVQAQLKVAFNVRLATIRNLVVSRWARFMEEGTLNDFIAKDQVPVINAEELGKLAKLATVVVVTGSPDSAGYDAASGNIELPSGIIDQLCPVEDLTAIDRALEEDIPLLGQLMTIALGNTSNSGEALDIVMKLRSSSALAVAERMELEFLSAIDFLLAHEFAHAVFDHRSGQPASTQVQREMRADALAFLLVDRTSEASLYKKLRQLEELMLFGGGQTGRTQDNLERVISTTTPGGEVLLRIYTNTQFESGDATHLPLNTRMEWINTWLAVPLAGTER